MQYIEPEGINKSKSLFPFLNIKP